jgi:hypothetical protein
MFDRRSVLSILFPALPGRERRRARAARSARWARARWSNPDMVGDLVGLGGVATLTPWQDGLPDTDPQRLAYAAGRRDLALELLALMGASPEDINRLFAEANDNPNPVEVPYAD